MSQKNLHFLQLSTNSKEKYQKKNNINLQKHILLMQLLQNIKNIIQKKLKK
jgi:hypothetical protein